MAQFRLRHSRLRGTDNARLRGTTTAVTNGTVYSGCATAGIVLQPRAATVMIPDPRPRVGVVMAGAGVTPSVRAAILNRDPLTVSTVVARQPRVAPTLATARRSATGRIAVPPSAVAPAAQTRNAVTGETPDVGTPSATAAPKVPGKATGTPKTPTKGNSPGRSC